MPVAVSAYTSEKRDIVGITGIQDFVNFTPGMNYSGTDRVSLRGAGRNTFYIGNDPGVASYTDGFYSASSSELFKTPLFVERAMAPAAMVIVPPARLVRLTAFNWLPAAVVTAPLLSTVK